MHSVEFAPDGSAIVMIAVDRGPRVSVAFAGDPLPEADRERLVPVRVEGSADEDLLEDASRAIEQYLYARGYSEAMAAYSRDERDGELIITFTVKRGRRHVVDAIRLERQHGGHRCRAAAAAAVEARRAVRAGDRRRRSRGHPQRLPRARLHARDGAADPRAASGLGESRSEPTTSAWRSRSRWPKVRGRSSAPSNSRATPSSPTTSSAG